MRLQVNIMEESKVGSLNKTEWLKILKGSGIAFAGAGLIGLGEFMGTLGDGSTVTAILTALSSIVVNAGRKLMTKQK